MTNEELNELYGSSKRDDTIFVGSQIRQLVGEIQRLRQAVCAAYDFMDTYGIVYDKNDSRHTKQQDVFDILRPIAHANAIAAEFGGWAE